MASPSKPQSSTPRKKNGDADRPSRVGGVQYEDDTDDGRYYAEGDDRDRQEPGQAGRFPDENPGSRSPQDDEDEDMNYNADADLDDEDENNEDRQDTSTPKRSPSPEDERRSSGGRSRDTR